MRFAACDLQVQWIAFALGKPFRDPRCELTQLLDALGCRLFQSCTRSFRVGVQPISHLSQESSLCFTSLLRIWNPKNPLHLLRELSGVVVLEGVLCKARKAVRRPAWKTVPQLSYKALSKPPRLSWRPVGVSHVDSVC